mmetsp:Transcript_21243/g.82420  ORF Transcript_21243/g.82420 Transcript_21243/m.82420 type:complete len:432 (+) Transcript_21243:28-1323(+)
MDLCRVAAFLALLVLGAHCSMHSTMPLFNFPDVTEIDIVAAKTLAMEWRAAHPGFDASTLPPLILLPGLMGSGLDSQLTDAPSPATCPRNQDWEQLWLSPDKLLRANCFVWTLGLNFDEVDGTFYNNEGVDIRPKDFGGLDGINYLSYTADGVPINGTEYMEGLIVYLEGIGYVPGQNLAGAPYDWRQANNPYGTWNDDLKALIESLYANNGNTPVWALAHSMGNLELTQMLNSQTQEWKDQYFGEFLSVAAPWSGASVSLHSIISGAPLLFLEPEVLRDLLQSFGSVVWMLPDAYLGNSPLVIVNETTQYSYYDMAKLLSDINATDSLAIYKHLAGSVVNMENPAVPIHCLYGINKDTELWYEYADGLSEPATAVHCGNGDGVVPIQSLEKCQEFDPLSTKTFNLVNHGDIMKDPAFFSYVGALLTDTSE